MIRTKHVMCFREFSISPDENYYVYWIHWEFLRYCLLSPAELIMKVFLFYSKVCEYSINKRWFHHKLHIAKWPLNKSNTHHIAFDIEVYEFGHLQTVKLQMGCVRIRKTTTNFKFSNLFGIVGNRYYFFSLKRTNCRNNQLMSVKWN